MIHHAQLKHFALISSLILRVILQERNSLANVMGAVSTWGGVETIWGDFSP
jgi:hypothetical protein